MRLCFCCVMQVAVARERIQSLSTTLASGQPLQGDLLERMQREIKVREWGNGG